MPQAKSAKKFSSVLESFQFKNLKDVLRHFHDDKTARAFLEKVRWNGEPYCPHCGCVGAYKLGDGKRYKCKVRKCHRKFSVTVGTIFENTNIPLDIWFAAIYLITSHKKGISSLQLHRDLGITQKTAWFMLHRIRYAVGPNANNWEKAFSKVTEIDETFVGGKVSNKHKSKRKLIANKTSPLIKTIVLGLLERDGNILARVIPDLKRMTVLTIVKHALNDGTIIYTDSAHTYTPLSKTHQHHTVNHEEDEYVRGDIHTNGIENFWSLMKRGIIGIYHYTSPKHLEKYVNEFTFRYNTRKKTEFERFNLMLSKSIGRLTYNQLIQKKK